MEKKKIIRKSHKIKKESVKKLAEQIKNAKTLMIVNVKNLPSKQFQEIKKTIREHALIKIAKKNILKRAIEELKKESILPLEKQVKENCAFAISGLEGFELARILSKNKTRIFAKAGQTANEDIEVKKGPTNLMPGPAISELGALGIQIAVEEGKISIKKSKVIIRKGQEIKENAASILQKLDIKPFDIGLEPVVFYDVQTEKIYSNIKIDSGQTAEDLRNASAKALGLAQRIVYYCKETIGYLLGKANAEGNILEKFYKETDNVIKDDSEKGKVKDTEEETKVQSQTTKTQEKPIEISNKKNQNKSKEES